MVEYYQRCIEQAFIDPIRSVVIVDDDYPTTMEVLDARLDEISEKVTPSRKSWLADPQPIKDVINEFRNGDRPFILDIHDAQTMTPGDEIEGASHLHQTDLLILDYELDRDRKDDFSRSLQVARRLMSNAHFNLIIVNTNNELDTVFQNFLLGLLFPNCQPLSDADNDTLEKAYGEIEGVDDFETRLRDAFGFSQYIGFLSDPKSSVRDLMKGAGMFAKATSLFKKAKLQNKNHWRLMARSALFSYQEECVAGGLMSETDLKVRSFSNKKEAKWIRSDRAFICFSHKPDKKKLLDCLQSALEDWNPKPSRLVLTKMLAEIDEHGVEMQNDSLQDDHSSALWYEGILDADDNQRKTKVDETVQRHVDGMLAKLLPEVRKFTNGLAVSENNNGTANADLVKNHYRVDLGNTTERRRAELSHNAMVCSQEKLGWHIETGHIFELGGSLWVCVSPACDTGPDQTRTVQDGRLRFAALKLHENPKDKMPKSVQSNRYVFLKSDNDIEVYSINKEPEAMPDIGIFYADNKGIFHEDMQLKVSRAEEVTLTKNDVETKNFIMQSYDIKVVAHLRYEYALNLIHRLGGAQTRVGLDFAGD